MWLFVFLWIFSWFSTNTSYAQEYTQADIDSVDMSYCNETWDMKYSKMIYVNTGEEKMLQFCFYNKSEKRIPITYGFVTATYNSVGNRVCNSNINPDFAFTLLPETKNRTIYTEPWTSTIIEEQVVVPLGIKGLQMWCVTAEIWAAPAIDMWSIFFLTVRKALDLNIFLWWIVPVKNSIKILDTTWWMYSTNKKVKSQIDKENNFVVWFLIKNDGNISQKITITGKVYNVLWFEKDFSTEGVINPNQTIEISSNIGLLPVYKWFYSVKFAIQNDPQSTIGVEDQAAKKIWNSTWTASIFVFSWISIVVILLLVLFIYKIVAPRRKIVDVSTATPIVSKS